jgi:hypothetical protein
MSRIRIALVMAGLVVASPTAAVNSQEQPLSGGQGTGCPGDPGNRAQRGPEGSRGPGGPGEFASDLVRLATNESVQTELKLTDRQKTTIKRIYEAQSKKRNNCFEKFRKESDAAKAEAAQEAQAQVLAGNQVDPSVDARGSGAGNPLFGALNSRGYEAEIYGGQPQFDTIAREQAARFQGQMAGDAVQNQSRQMMRGTMQEFQQECEHELARVLDKPQCKRLREIRLQVEGAGAVLRDDVAEKLQLREDQRAEIQEIVTQTNAARRELMRKNWGLLRSRMPTLPADPDSLAADGQSENPPDEQNAPSGGGGRGSFDPEALRTVLEQPQLKAKMAETRKEQQQLREREYALVYKAMDRRQVATFKKMLGKPFDVELLVSGLFREGPRGRRNGNNLATDPAKALTRPGSSPASAAVPPDSTTSTPASKPAASPRRPSLRERRGLGGQKPSADAPPN